MALAVFGYVVGGTFGVAKLSCGSNRMLAAEPGFVFHFVIVG